ncbi:MAG: MFS transporter [Deinococcales bacterium]
MLRGLLDTRDKRFLFAAGSLGFLAIGAVQAMYGPAFPAFLARYHLGLGQVGVIVSAAFLGSFFTIAASGLLLVRFGYRRVLATGAGAAAFGATGVALSPTWGLALASALVGGLGFGLLDVATNLLFARAFGSRASAALNLLNAAFGLGAVAGPLLVGLVAPHVAPAFLLVAGLCVVVSGTMAKLPAAPTPLRLQRGAPRVPLAPLAGFLLLYFLYVSSEVGVASWEPTYLAPVLGASTAAYLTSLFWGALTVGRFVAAAVSDLLRPADLVMGALLLALAAAWLAVVTPLAPVAYAVVGLAFAPVFPTALAWLQEVFPLRAERLGAVVIAGASLGPVASAPVIGWAVAGWGTRYVPVVLGLVLVALLTVTALLWWRARLGAGPTAAGEAVG